MLGWGLLVNFDSIGYSSVVGRRQSPLNKKRGEVRAEVKYRGNVDGLEAIEVEEGEVGSVLFTELVDVWEIVPIEGKVERNVLECR
jgi:hypothetical protein